MNLTQIDSTQSRVEKEKKNIRSSGGVLDDVGPIIYPTSLANLYQMPTWAALDVI